MINYRVMTAKIAEIIERELSAKDMSISDVVQYLLAEPEMYTAAKSIWGHYAKNEIEWEAEQTLDTRP